MVIHSPANAIVDGLVLTIMPNSVFWTYSFTSLGKMLVGNGADVYLSSWEAAKYFSKWFYHFTPTEISEMLSPTCLSHIFFVLFLSLSILAILPCVQCTVALICMSQTANDENFFWVLTGHLKYLFKSFGMLYWIPHCTVNFFFKFYIYLGNRLLIDIFTANNFSVL